MRLPSGLYPSAARRVCFFKRQEIAATFVSQHDQHSPLWGILSDCLLSPIPVFQWDVSIVACPSKRWTMWLVFSHKLPMVDGAVNRLRVCPLSQIGLSGGSRNNHPLPFPFAAQGRREAREVLHFQQPNPQLVPTTACSCAKMGASGGELCQSARSWLHPSAGWPIHGLPLPSPTGHAGQTLPSLF